MVSIKCIEELDKKISSTDISKKKVQWQENFVQVIPILTWLFSIH